METLADFLRIANGYQPTEIKNDNHSWQISGKLEFRRSSDMGGCGTPGCNCSPGLWIAAFKDGMRAYVRFGTIDDSYGAHFTPEQQRSFLDMCDELGINDY